MYEQFEEDFKARANYSNSKRFFLCTAVPWFLVFFLVGMFVIDPIVKSIYLYIFFLACILAYLLFYYSMTVAEIKQLLRPVCGHARASAWLLFLSEPGFLCKIYFSEGTGRAPLSVL